MTNKMRRSINKKIKSTGNILLKKIANFWRGKLIKPAPSYWAMIPIKIEKQGYRGKKI